jgi:hypothetical protein
MVGAALPTDPRTRPAVGIARQIAHETGTNQRRRDSRRFSKRKPGSSRIFAKTTGLWLTRRYPQDSRKRSPTKSANRTPAAAMPAMTR